MNHRTRRALYALALLDLLGGGFLLGWPGAWQELAHPAAMGTVFYTVQRQGATWLGRAGLALWLTRRPGPIGWAALGGAWAIEVPGAALVAWRTAGTGPGPWIQAGLALLAAVIAGLCWRGARRADHPGVAPVDGGEGR